MLTLEKQNKDILLFYILSDQGINQRFLFPVKLLLPPGAQQISLLLALLSAFSIKADFVKQRNFTWRFLILYRIQPCLTWNKITVGSWFIPNTAFISSQPWKDYYCKIYFMYKLDLSKWQVRVLHSLCSSRSPSQHHFVDTLQLIKYCTWSGRPGYCLLLISHWKWSTPETSFYFCFPFFITCSGEHLLPAY